MADNKMDFSSLLGGAAPFDVSVRNITRQVKTGKKQRLTLLDDVSMYFKPGTMTLVLGAPGCGKTTLFNVLANRDNDKKHPLTGQVLFNGQPASRKTHDRSVAYVTQEDLHLPTLNVRETLKFSVDCQAEESVSEASKDNKVDLLLRLLDLTHVQNTYVGNELIRGISGGQKKRVTIGVALTSSPSVILMDEATNGLDANTALEVISSMRGICNELKIPVVAALLQPSPEICDLFDNLLILSKGKVGYFGTYKNAISYFSRHGLEGGKFQSDPEFLQEAVEFSHRYSDKTTDQMVALYRESPEYQDIQRVLGPSTDPMASLLDSSGVPERTYTTSLALNLRRDITVMRRDLDTLRGRIMEKIVMGLILGSLFYNLPSNQSGLRTRLAVLFFSNVFLTFTNVGTIAPFFQNRPVYYQQREQKYFSPIAYFLSKSVLDLPIIIVECIIFGTLIYWMVGLHSEANRFVFFLLALMSFASTFIASEEVASGFTPSIFGSMILFSGFIIPRPSIPDWWVWLYYGTPLHYILEACMINELVGTEYHCRDSERLPPPASPLFALPYPQGFSNQSICAVTYGEQQLDNLHMKTHFGWRWANLFFFQLFTIVFLILTFVAGAKLKHVKEISKKSASVPIDGEAIQLEVAKEKAESKKENGAFMSWENLTYAVDVKKDKKVEQLVLLDNINGYVRPGMLMALMGPSGAGKSTLLDVLANRKTGGHTSGNILINGTPRDQYFNRFSAYVEQQDVLMPLATVYETILFSAQVRLPRELTKHEIDLRIKDTLHILDLEPIQNRYAGGLSLEQRKRLTIAVELIADPRLLFLDEPTSGLDSQAALNVMEVVKRVADTGRAVICTIHQPSVTVFSYFDHLLLLKRGGKTIYFGPTGSDCSMVLEYFSSIGWECGAKRNPADFILDAAAITSDNVTSLAPNQKDPEEAFKASALKREMESRLKDIPDGFQAPKFNKKYASNFARQIECNLRREWANVWRRTIDIRARILRSIFLGLLMGTMYLQIDHSQKGANDRFGLLFFLQILMGTQANSVVPNIVDGRAVFYREQGSGAYRAFTYLVGVIVTELPVTLGTSLLLSIIAYFLSGLAYSASQFFFFAFVTFIYGCLTMAFVIFLSLATPNAEISQALVGVFTSIFALFSGFTITRPNIPKYWVWMYYLDMMHYPLEAVAINELDGTWFGCHHGKGAVNVPIPEFNTTKQFCPITSGNQVLESVDYHVSHKFENVGIIFAYWAGMIVLCLLALQFIRHIKR